MASPAAGSYIVSGTSGEGYDCSTHYLSQQQLALQQQSHLQQMQQYQQHQLMQYQQQVRTFHAELQIDDLKGNSSSDTSARATERLLTIQYMH